MVSRRATAARTAARLALLLAACTLALELAFLLRIAAMALVDPRSTTYQRSEVRRLLTRDTPLRWQHAWVDYEQISPQVVRAVIASEDAGFVEHLGVDWDAVERAWVANTRRADPARAASRLRGGSTITQQLAKNLLLSGERTIPRKAQELLLSWMLEATLSKRRILEIYLNHVEWGEGVFGIQAAARHHHRSDASRLNAEQAARLAVMLPAPRRFERRPGSDYLAARAETIRARMPAVVLP